MSGLENISNRALNGLKTLTFLIFVLISGFYAIPGYAQEADAAAVVTPDTAEAVINNTLIAEIDPSITVKLDGETLQSTQVHRDEDGALYVNAMPIFSALNNAFSYDETKKALIVRRSQDGVVMELYTDTGVIKANGKPLGKLKSFGQISAENLILTPNAIAVLSGTRPKFDEDRKEFLFELDPRLRVATGFEIYVNDISLGNLNPAPKSVGPVLILPLLPIADELGHDVSVIDGGETLRVRRSQDSAVFTLNMSTGLVKLRDRPHGIIRDLNYLDATNLLLPVDAIETLTGTHISTEAGTNRIDIRLDDRLAGSIEPLAKVKDLAADTPFTPESLSFHLGPDTVNTVTGKFRVKQLNGQIRYEAPDLPSSAKEAEPSWLSLDFAHINGVRGSIGDYSADFRELDGVGFRRIRGASIVKETEKARIAVAAGAPATGSRSISQDQSRLKFDGFAAGARYASKDGWEAGLAYASDGLSDDQMAVLSAISGRLGRTKDKTLQWDVNVDAGYFNGSAREKTVDFRGRALTRVDLSKTVTLDGFVQYDGAEFLRTDLDGENREADITDALDPDGQSDADDTAVPDLRLRGMDLGSVGTSLRVTPRKDVGFLKNPAGAVRVQTRRSGVFEGQENAVTTSSVGLSLSTAIADSGVNISADGTAFRTKYKNGQNDEDGYQLNLRAYRRFENLSIRGQYSEGKRGSENVRRGANVTVSGYNYDLPLPKNAHLNVSPSASALWSGDNVSLRGGLFANLHSGDVLGEKTKVDASFGVLQSFSSHNRHKTDKFLTVTLGRRVRLGKNMAVGMAYRNNLEGDHRVGLVLDGRFEFNEGRKFKTTKKGRGVLKGRAFLDKNRDGIKQEDEPPISRAMVRIAGSRLALQTDVHGQFAIQNIKEGIYEVRVDGRSLPLGYSLDDDAKTKVTIQDGFVTDIELPVVQRGQIRGFAFADANENGVFDAGEERIEGAKISIKTKGNVENLTYSYSSSFGQYAFDDLPAGEYEISVVESEKMGIAASKPISLVLNPDEDLMLKFNVPVMRSKQIRVAQNEEIRPPPETNTMAQDPIGPAPP